MHLFFPVLRFVTPVMAWHQHFCEIKVLGTALPVFGCPFKHALNKLASIRAVLLVNYVYQKLEAHSIEYMQNHEVQL